ncbi:MerR family transcriptional regulator [Aliiglaciecola lipolytica]|nr:MerR family transcriptional regulator [Aliiglaciecola lipolytica]
MRVKEIADALGISADSVRYYTRIGLLEPSKSHNGYKYYRPQDLTRLRFIISARSLGFSVNDIKEILVTSSRTNVPCPTVRCLIEKRLKETERRYQDMHELRMRMRKAMSEWENTPDQHQTADTICHLIEGFTALKS